MNSPKPKKDRSTYPLFKHMSDEHGLTLLESELYEIVLLARQVAIAPEHENKHLTRRRKTAKVRR